MDGKEELCVGNNTLILETMHVAVKERVEETNDVIVKKEEDHEETTDNNL